MVLRLIGKWLNAGVLQGLELSYPEAGTPQGGVISPLLANIWRRPGGLCFHHIRLPRDAPFREVGLGRGSGFYQRERKIPLSAA